MNYDEIKKNLREAGKLVDDGDVAAADTKIRSMLGKGLTGADLDANMTRAQMKKLREHTK